MLSGPRVKRSAAAAAPVLAFALASAQTTTVAPFDASRHLPARAERIYKAMDEAFDASAAYETVVFMDQFWRLAGNAGFLASQDRIRDRLQAAGFEATPLRAADQSKPRVWYEEFPNEGRSWDHSLGTLSIVNADGSVETVLSREQHRVALCINSFSTPPGGLNAPLVDVGQGDPASFAGKNVKGAIVLGDVSVGSLWRTAVIQHGAAGVVSTAIAPYVVRPATGRDPDEILDVLQWGAVPYDEQRKAFGFKASRRAATRLREAAARGPVTVRAEVVSTFSTHPNRTLVAEIPGTVRADERIVMVAHVQEPGANDDASGCATLMSIATALTRAIADGKLPAPARTLTFLWVDEIRGSRRWIADHPEEARRVQYMFALDMDGRGHSEDGWHIPDREAGRSLGRVGTSLGSPLGMGRQRCQCRVAEGKPAQRSAPCRLPPPRARQRLGRANQSARRRQRSHTVCRRGHSVAAQLALYGSVLSLQPGSGGQDERRGDEERRGIGRHNGDAARLV